MSRIAALLSLHGKLAGIALSSLLLWGAYRISVHNRAELLIDSVTIAIEHAQPAEVFIARSLGGREHLIDIGNESDETLGISLPELWERDEVRNVPLATIAMDSPSFGFKKWTLPPHAVVTFRAPREWRELTIHNPSKMLLHMRIKTVDLVSNKTDTESYLLQEDDLIIHFNAVKR